VRVPDRSTTLTSFAACSDYGSNLLEKSSILLLLKDKIAFGTMKVASHCFPPSRDTAALNPERLSGLRLGTNNEEPIRAHRSTKPERDKRRRESRHKLENRLVRQNGLGDGVHMRASVSYALAALGLEINSLEINSIYVHFSTRAGRRQAPIAP
jgi:hypothetical protein